MESNHSPSPLLSQWGRDLQLWLFIVLLLQTFRLLLITLFQEQATQLTLHNLIHVSGQGLRYDISTAALWIMPTFVLALIPFKPVRQRLKTIRKWIALLFLLITIPILGADIIFFDEYGDQFNQHMFGIVHDDTTAILITIWKSYHPLWFLSGVGLSLWLLIRVLKWWIAYTPQVVSITLNRPLTILVGTIGFLAFAAMLRGGTLWGEPIRLKHAFIVNDIFLNRTVLNPYSALRFTLQEKMLLESGSALETIWPDSIPEALSVINPNGHGKTIDQWLSTESQGSPYPKPKHIFMVLMESQSGWPVLPRYREIGLSPQLSRLADHGIYFPNFLPSGSGTIPSLNALIAGLPDNGLNINYEPKSLKPYPYGIGTIMQSLGYQTNFFYGGYLSWQRLDTYALNQGFDTIHGGGMMSSNGEMTNEWGVDDSILFDYIINTIDPDKPSFNFILTTSNHPPYDLDLDALGYPVKALPPPLEATKDETIKVLGHLWYADQQIGRFTERVQKRLPYSLFAFTGDHTARLQIRFEQPNVFEQSAVPFILYGPNIIGNEGRLIDTPGSHIDIASTLFELIAPKGMPYAHFGEDLLSPNADDYAFGHQLIGARNYVATDNEQPMPFPLPFGKYQQPDKTTLIQLRKHAQALKAVSWSRVRETNDNLEP